MDAITHHHFYDTVAKEAQSDFNPEGPWDKLNLKGILQYVTHSVHFKSVSNESQGKTEELFQIEGI